MAITFTPAIYGITRLIN